jgi:hypothetical protein
VGLTTAEIRDRAERFRAAVLEEVHDARSGRKAWPELAPLYETQGILESSRTLPVVERAIASAEEDEERRLRKLLRWTARHHLEASNARLDDEFAYWRATSKVNAGDIAVPVSQAANLAHSIDAREVRRELEEARCLTLEEAVPLQLDRLTSWREAAAELGYGGYREAVERLAGVNLLGVLNEARRLIEETEDVYREAVRDELRWRIGIRLDEAESHDAGWLKRMPWLDGSCEEGDVLGTLRKDLRDIGLPLEYGGHVTVEHEPFPGPGMTASCTPVRVPDRIKLLVMPTVSQPDCVALLTSVGRALHYAYTDSRLSFEDRALGDLAVAQGHGLLFAGLSGESAWVRRTRGLQGQALEEYLRSTAVVDLFSIREAAARLEFELELSESARPREMGSRWAEILGSATGFRFDPRSFLERLGQRFGVARYLRGRMLAAQLRRELRERFDEDWYRNPDSGPFLGDWFAHGLRFSAAELAAALGNDRLGADALISVVRESFD